MSFQWLIGVSLDSNGWMRRKEAANFLTSLDYPMTQKRLEHFAALKDPTKGPPFKQTGPRSIFYHRDDLTQWKEQQERNSSGR